jgi:uncharacterized membrane protein
MDPYMVTGANAEQILIEVNVKKIDGVMIYFWWNVWKECNRKTFQQKHQQPIQVAQLCKDEIQQYQMATRPSTVVE